MQIKKKILLSVLFASTLAISAAVVGCTPSDLDEDPDKTYAVSYAVGEGTGTAPVGASYKEGEKFNLPDQGEMTKADYTFDGWSYNSQKYAAGFEFTMPASAVEFVAQWKANDGTELPPSPPASETKYTITYDLNGGTGTAPTQEDKKEGEKITIADDSGFTKTGYEFTGWKLGNTVYQPDDEYTIGTENITFIAQWAATYTVTYTLGIGESGTAPVGGTYKAGDIVTVAQPTGLSKEGYVFYGWNNGNVTYTAGQTFTMPSRNVTFTSEWLPSNPAVKYTVTVVKSTTESQISSITGNVPTITDKSAGEKFTIDADLSFPHYTLSKWRVQYYAGDYWTTEANYDPDTEITMPDHNIRIGGVWVANNVTISFDANGGTGTMANVTKQYNTNLALTTTAFDCTFTAPAGKEFKGWALTKTDANNGVKIANGTKLDASIVSAQDTLTLYAVWDEAVSTAIDINTIAGHWTDASNAHSIDITTETFGNAYVQGGGILDGKYAIVLGLTDEYAVVMDVGQTGRVYYDITYSNSTLTLTSDEGSSIVFTSKTALIPTSATQFVGNWSRSLPSGTQPWVIESDKAYYNASLKQADIAIIGSYITLYYNIDDYQTDAFVLHKDSDKLVGYYNPYDGEKNISSTEFNVGDFYTLTANGTLNQIVNNGSTVDASKLPTVDGDGPITGWVIAGTSTVFNPATATLTANTSITAVHGSAEKIITYSNGSAGTDYSGVKNITINFDTNEIIFNKDTSPVSITVTPTTTAQGLGYKVTQSQGGGLIGTIMWIVVSADEQSVTIYDDWNGPDVYCGSFTV